MLNKLILLLIVTREAICVANLYLLCNIFVTYTVNICLVNLWNELDIDNPSLKY